MSCHSCPSISAGCENNGKNMALFCVQHVQHLIPCPVTPASTTWCLYPGQALAIMGPNGAGKSTFLHTLAGLNPAPPAVRWGWLPTTSKDSHAATYQQPVSFTLQDHTSQINMLCPLQPMDFAYLPQQFTGDRAIPLTVHQVVTMGAQAAMYAQRKHDKTPQTSQLKFWHRWCGWKKRQSTAKSIKHPLTAFTKPSNPPVPIPSYDDLTTDADAPLPIKPPPHIMSQSYQTFFLDPNIGQSDKACLTTQDDNRQQATLRDHPWSSLATDDQRILMDNQNACPQTSEQATVYHNTYACHYPTKTSCQADATLPIEQNTQTSHSAPVSTLGTHVLSRIKTVLGLGMNESFDNALSAGYSTENQVSQRVHHALSAFGLLPFAHRLVNDLSGGQFQKVLWARTWAQSAPLMILDEPFSGLDQHAVDQGLQAIDQWRREGRIVIVSLHNRQRALEHFDRVFLLSPQGATFGTPKEVLTPDQWHDAHCLPPPQQCC